MAFLEYHVSEQRQRARRAGRNEVAFGEPGNEGTQEPRIEILLGDEVHHREKCRVDTSLLVQAPYGGQQRVSLACAGCPFYQQHARRGVWVLRTRVQAIAFRASSASASISGTSTRSSSAAPANEATAPKTRSNSGLSKALIRKSMTPALNPLIDNEMPLVTAEAQARTLPQTSIERTGDIIAFEIEKPLRAASANLALNSSRPPSSKPSARPAS